MATRTVPLIDLGKQHAELRSRIDQAIANVIDSGQFVLGPEVAAFETELGEACQAKHAVGVSSGTDALLLALMALGVAPGDEVVTTAFSFFATAGVIARLGATPVFVDIEEHSFNLDPVAALAAITDRCKAILPVHLYGRLAALPKTDVPILEDAAQSIGSGPPRGLAACYSFFPTKNIGALGDAGAVVTNDAAYDDKLRLLRTHGGRPKYIHAEVGGNFRLDALQAAVLRIKLESLDAWTQQRRANASYYSELFADAQIDNLRVPIDSPEHVYHQYTIRVPRRDELGMHLKKHGIRTEVYYPQPLHLQHCFAELGYKRGNLPIAEACAKSVLSLPIHPHLSRDDQAYVVDRIRDFYS